MKEIAEQLASAGERLNSVLKGIMAFHLVIGFRAAHTCTGISGAFGGGGPSESQSGRDAPKKLDIVAVRRFYCIE